MNISRLWTQKYFSMTKTEVAQIYVDLLAKGDMNAVIDLFSQDGVVHSPIYGLMQASEFYHKLAEDTTSSSIEMDGIFHEKESERIAIYFKYTWTVKSGKQVIFDVVDVITFDEQGKIQELKIIYDTVISRRLVEELS